MIDALAINDDGTLELARVERVPGSNTYADKCGRELYVGDRRTVVIGWGAMSGFVRVLTDDMGIERYYIK
jgi:hypothetical protein